MADEPRLPVPRSAGRSLDRAAMERVLARAAELQMQSGDADPSDALTETQLLELGREVGIAPDVLRRALAEEHTRVMLPEESGLAARVAGPAIVGAARVVDGAPMEVLATIDAWMRREECLQSKRRLGDRQTWEPRRDMGAQLRMGFNLGGRGYHLARAAEVGASVAAVEPRRTHVQLTADVGPSRRRRLAGGGTAAAAGTVTGGSLLLLPFANPAVLMEPILALGAVLTAAGMGVGWAVARSHRNVALRVQTALEQLLDRLEHGELQTLPPGGRLLETLQAALKPPPAR